MSILPSASSELYSLIAYLSAKPDTPVTLTGSGDTRTFTMPEGDVTVLATFRSTDYPTIWEDARKIIENASFNILQAEANTPTDLRYRLAERINQLLKETGFVISFYDIVVFDINFRPAAAGSPENRSGVNGYFEFRVTPPEVPASAYNSGIITATPYGTTDNDPALTGDGTACNVTAWTQNGRLHVDGLSRGEPLRLYNLSGILLHQIAANGNKVTIPLPERGFYILVTNGCRIKIVN